MRPKKATLILVDEQTLFREGLAALCEATGQYEIVGQCGDGGKAVEVVCSKKPDLAVLDLSLTEVGALGVIQKASRRGVATRFVILSTRRDRKTVLEVLRSGAAAFMLKSDSAAWFFRGLRNVLEGSIFVSPQIQLSDLLVSLRQRGGEPYEKLTFREHQILMMVIQGWRGKEIADQLDLSPKTVSTHLVRVMKKLNIHDIPGLVRFGVRQGLIPLR